MIYRAESSHTLAKIPLRSLLNWVDDVVFSCMLCQPYLAVRRAHMCTTSILVLAHALKIEQSVRTVGSPILKCQMLFRL